MLFYFFNLCCVYDVANHNSFGKQQTNTADNFPSWPKWKTRLFFTLQDDCVHCKNLNSEGKDKMSKNKISKKQWFLDYPNATVLTCRVLSTIVYVLYTSTKFFFERCRLTTKLRWLSHCREETFVFNWRLQYEYVRYL